MTLTHNPYNMSYHYDDNLHEIPDAPDDMAAAVRYFAAKAESEQDYYEKMTLWGEIGVYYRMLARLDEAESYINAALAAANDLHDKRAQLVNLIRLAHVYQWRGHFSTANRIFDQVIMICEVAADRYAPSRQSLGHYLDYAYQHMGQNLLDQERYPEATRYFRKALRLRQEKGDVSLMAASKLALRTVRAKMQDH